MGMEQEQFLFVKYFLSFFSCKHCPIGPTTMQCTIFLCGFDVIPLSFHKVLSGYSQGISLECFAHKFDY